MLVCKKVVIEKNSHFPTFKVVIEKKSFAARRRNGRTEREQWGCVKKEGK